MLVLGRYPGQAIAIGEWTLVRVLYFDASVARLEIRFPESMSVSATATVELKKAGHAEVYCQLRETIQIGEEVFVTYVRWDYYDDQPLARVGIWAPRDIRVDRMEVRRRMQAGIPPSLHSRAS